MDKSQKIFAGIATIGTVFVVSINQVFSGSLITLILSLLGLFAALVAGKKLKEQFGVSLLFIRRGDVNYWGGAFGGLIGGTGAFLGSHLGSSVSLGDFVIYMTLGTIYLVLVSIVFYGMVLQDVKDGYIELDDE